MQCNLLLAGLVLFVLSILKSEIAASTLAVKFLLKKTARLNIDKFDVLACTVIFTYILNMPSYMDICTQHKQD